MIFNRKSQIEGSKKLKQLVNCSLPHPTISFHGF